MVGQRTGVILRQVQALLGAGTFSGLSDLQLLERFLERRDEVAELAFAVLVERHGPMVLGVCRRIAGDPHDADDAFQATFLVLARRARSIRVEGSLGRWLFGVATRVATRARSDDRRRRLRERSGADRLEVVGSDANLTGIERAEVQAMIAREIAGLPARFQAPVLLCDLEGTSCEEAARRLGWPVGTVKSRLSRARARLRDRLTRRGLTPVGPLDRDRAVAGRAGAEPGGIHDPRRPRPHLGPADDRRDRPGRRRDPHPGSAQDHDPHQAQARRGEPLAGRHGLGGPARPGLPSGRRPGNGLYAARKFPSG